jgi:hypothetical protein
MRWAAAGQAAATVPSANADMAKVSILLNASAKLSLFYNTRI